MTDELTDMGPIDYLVLEFPGNRMTGEGLSILIDLVDRGIIRVLDLVFVRRDLDGSTGGLTIADLDGDGDLDLAVFDGAASGLLEEEDLDEAADVLRPGKLRRCPDLREPVGGTDGQRPAPIRGGARGQRAHPPVGHRVHIGQRVDPLRKDRTMPGLLRGIARTAVVAGTATAVSNRVSRRQAGRWAAQESTVDNGGDPKLAALRELSELRSQGVLADDEFEEQKRLLLAQ